ncbi:FecCD family ABC transporter permease [Arhodomonas sp. AD133]|uniref:FecCD family ABC transporter permease n=1 Tax=Arhodomonas sp. AD133 TaxID=3415009 RepID=UPI003EBF85C5
MTAPHRDPLVWLPAALMSGTALLCLVSLLTGAGAVTPAQSLDYLLGGTDPQAATVIQSLRLPRTLAALLVGTALGGAGCLLQAMTRNPLAETGLLGINAGAALAVVVGIAFTGAATGCAYLGWAFGGALLGSGCVLALSHAGGGNTPLRLILAGVALGSTFHGLSATILLADQQSYDQFRYWTMGTLSGTSGALVWQVWPAVAAALALSLVLLRPLAALLLGDDSARALGHRPGLVRLGVATAVTLAAGGAVALAGPIAFLGLLAAHAGRAVAGPELRRQFLLAALAGAAILLAADIAARVVVRPFEAPASVLVALIGAPFMVWIVRAGRGPLGAGASRS